MSDASKKVSVSREHLDKLIDAVVYTLGSADYAPIEEDDHYRYLLSNQVEAICDIAEEIGVDLWEETAGPFGREYTPIAILLREVERKFGMPRCCLVPECNADVVWCAPRPKTLATGTRWPPCPELCEHHTAARLELLERRVRRELPHYDRATHVGGMPMPAVAHLAPTPAQLGLFITN